jgi:preprotein translocase subunit SecF
MALLHEAHGPHAADQRAKQRYLLDLEGGVMAGGGIAGRLYRGDVSINFVGRQRLWYAISGLIILVSAVALAVRRLNFSLEFKGGSSFTFPPTASTSQTAISRVVSTAGGGDASVQYSSSSSLHQWTVQTGALTSDITQKVAGALAQAFHLAQSSVSVQLVGPTWGGQVTSKAVEALIIFLVVIVIYLSIAFEWRMAVAAFVALLHDILITVGVYALAGFSVSPTSVVGLLTILGYSLYDTVVVFDKVRENTAGLLTTQRSTYSQAANLALNQTLVRSINTSLTALLPVASILFVGAGLLGAGTLKDLALVLFVGMLSGTYSSIFIATPVLADLKEREPQYKDLAAKVNRRLAGGRSAQRGAPEAGGATSATGPTAPAAPATPVTGVTAPGSLAGPEDQGQDTEETSEQDAVDGVAVSAAARTGDTPPRPVTRQQRVTGSTQRRPGARKKRR